MPINPEQMLADAFRRLNARDLDGAERLCAEVLRERPRHGSALHLLGVVKLVGGRAADAAELIGRALKEDASDAMAWENLGLAHLAGRDAPQAESAFRRAMANGARHGLVHMRLGMALAMQGRAAEAEAALRAAAERSPGDADIQLNLGNVLAQAGRNPEALACFEKAVALQPRHVDAHFNTGTLLMRTGRLDEAAEAYRRTLSLAPDYADAHNNLGMLHEKAGRANEAMRSYRRTIEIDPRHVHAHSNLGNLLRSQRLLEDAAQSCERALALQPGFVDALINLGNVRLDQGRFGDAQSLYEQAVTAEPGNIDARRNLGALFKAQGRMEEAIACCRAALDFDPGQSAVYGDLGNMLRDTGNLDAAIAVLQKAIALDPSSAGAHFNLAETLKVPMRFEEAIAAYERALALKPDFTEALSGLIYLRQHVCDWNGIEELWERLRGEIGKAGSGISPFSVLNMPYSAAEQLACASEWSRQRLGPFIAARAGLGMTVAPRASHARLRIGYLSWDFHQHATSYLVAELFELHDRERFEVFAYSYGPDDGSPIRARIRGACEHFVDVSAESYVETARHILRDEIDVLVDLKGYTQGARSQIVALRPAPVQVNWLGYPGSMGTDCIDYILADPFVIPQGAEHGYAEKVMRLPDCYQVNDRKRAVSEFTPTREECGLPPGGVVLCCFNQTAKILPQVFALWARVLQAVPGSVLWLLETNLRAGENLRQATASHGISPERLVFAPRKPMSEHLARYRLADLALDTFPYTSHTTASDALWAGCPLATCAGETFASRVAGSILINAGMGDLVTDNMRDYEQLLVRLAGAPARLSDLKRRLERARDSHPLFDTPRFVRNLEQAYETMFAAFLEGKS